MFTLSRRLSLKAGLALLSMMLLGALALSTAQTARAATLNGFDLFIDLPSDGCQGAFIDVYAEVTGTTDDGGGDDRLMWAYVDADGNPLDTDEADIPVGVTDWVNGSIDDGLPSTLDHMPITVALFDITASHSGNTNSYAAYVETLIDGELLGYVVIDSSYFDFCGLPEGAAWTDFTPPPPGLCAGDGRINTNCAAPVITYCDSEMVKVYKLDLEQEGSLLFTYKIADLPTSGSSDKLLKQVGKVKLYWRHEDGLLKLLAPQPDGKIYYMIFDPYTCTSEREGAEWGLK